ncbi:hypothetical protein SADUNF_Sadunf10G0063500 [Salix dunnii]|uniref:Inositol polyphosphate-related phosphatase domain-containing protein n=1 Tax=Salix dunnii TaxID=1413687 RepID=A0A835JSK4_9ROSI|nr:hypothetical protein SADUNF_Sadunf10G0063500 [Salix dunnii]
MTFLDLVPEQSQEQKKSPSVDFFAVIQTYKGLSLTRHYEDSTTNAVHANATNAKEKRVLDANLTSSNHWVGMSDVDRSVSTDRVRDCSSVWVERFDTIGGAMMVAGRFGSIHGSGICLKRWYLLCLKPYLCIKKQGNKIIIKDKGVTGLCRADIVEDYVNQFIIVNWQYSWGKGVVNPTQDHLVLLMLGDVLRIDLSSDGVVMWPRLVTNRILGERLRSNNFVADFPSNAEASSLLDISSLGQPSLSENSILINQLKHNFQNYKVFISTWNVGGIAPQDDLDIADWLDTPNNMCDIYVFGFQEIVPLRASYVLGSENSKISMKWNSLIREALNKKIRIPEGFRCVISKQMVGILISVWVRSDLRPYVRHPRASSVGCGIMGYLGNKGSVSVRFQLHETSFCFVCSHLASGGREGDEKHRNSDVAEIFSRTSFPRGASFDLPRKILDHEISLPEATTRLLVDRKEWNALLDNDQLRMELMSGQVFEGWHEGLVRFAPTYKYCLNSNVYFGCVEGRKGRKWRAPAWCDRIIWYGEGLQQRLYTRGESNLSDHRPVKAIFTAQVQVPSTFKRLQKFFLSERFDQRTTSFDQMSSSDKSRCRGRSSFKL